MINKATAILYYIKEPTTPVYDYYIDVNGNYVYLDEGETHEWEAGQIDSDGTTHTVGDDDWDSKTIELEWKNQDKIEIASRILRDMGVELTRQEVQQYAQQLITEQ